MTAPWRRFAIAVAATIAAATACAPASAQVPISEPQAKAAFVLNFARFVEWPATAFASREAPLVACVVGRDAIGPSLSALEGRQVQGRPMKVRRAVSAADTRGCHVVFVAETEERRVVPILRALADQPVLTVSDADGFVDLGGGIGLVSSDERLQFEVNRGALEQAQLKASASLLKLARNILETRTRN